MKLKPRSNADRVGFAVFVTLAAVLAAVLLVGTPNNGADSSQVVTAAGPGAQPAAVETAPAIVPTTEPVALPSAPVQIATLASQTAEADAEASVDAAIEVPAEAPPAPAAAQDPEPASAPATNQAQTSQSATEPAAASGTQAVAAADPAATAVPNPQPQATAVPNPQPQATAVPNPQPQATAATTTVSVPADAPAGGTFTHTLTATVARPSLHSSANGPEFMPTFNGVALPAVNPTVFGNPLVYRVLAGEPGDAWAKVYVPARPNGTTAWVQTSQFNWGSSNRMLQINVSNNTVTVFEGSNVLLTTSAVTGSSVSPTPLANGWVEEVMAGPSAAYGTKLISLGMFSDALNTFGGSIPKIALHGTNNPGLMGQYASNGCIRVRNDIIEQIATMLPTGSKVTIVG